jgi:hypothetical protein
MADKSGGVICCSRAITDLLKFRTEEWSFKALPTETPPPYFPQNMLSPGDEKTARKVRLVFWGCALLALLGLVGLIVGVVYVVKSLL